MPRRDKKHPCAFDTLLIRNVPHILEKIFLSLDYESFKKCLKVSTTWNELLMSGSFLSKRASVFHEGIKKDEWGMSFATQQGDTDTVKRLLSSGMLDVNCIFSSDIWMPTPLCMAAESGRTGVVKILLDAGADLNKADRSGRTPLYFAAWSGSKEVVKVLLDRGADPDNRPF